MLQLNRLTVNAIDWFAKLLKIGQLEFTNSGGE
jgi:hypothetical protein